MTFLNPIAFYLIGTIPIVLALHFLKLRRQRYIVPSMLLWRASAEDQKANVPFQRLRNLLLPLLQCLFLLLIIASVARPALRIPGIIHGKIIVIVDNSASMLSKEMGKTRLELAKQEVLKNINQVTASGGMMLMATHAPKPHIIQTFTTDKNKLRLAVEYIKPTHKPSDWTSVYDYATRYVDSQQDQIIMIGDSFDNIPETSMPINKISVGESVDNIGIVHVSIEKSMDQYTILARIQNWTDTPRKIDVRLELEDNIAIADKSETIPAGEVKPILFSVTTEGLEGKPVCINLYNPKDDFDLDNKVWVILRKTTQFSILLVSDRDQPLLMDVLRNYGDHVAINKVSKDEFHSTEDADLIIIDGTIPSEQEVMNTLDRENYILINTREDLAFVEDSAVEIVTTPVTVIRENTLHPTMQDVSLIGMQVSESVDRTLPIWGESLVETEKGSLIWVGTNAGRQYLFFEFDAFNPVYSRFPFIIPDAPIFIYQCLEWFESNVVPIKSLTYQNFKFNYILKCLKSKLRTF